MPDLVRVLIVDDSAYVRKVVAQMLGRNPFIEVIGTARDGQEALERAEELDPHVITCDLNMPVMDGVAFVRAQMARRPTPIVIISIAEGAGEQVLSALDAGAVDFVQKPTALATERLMDISDELVEKVKAAARSPRRPVPSRKPVAVRYTWKDANRFDIVVLGISTGGPQGLKRVVPELPADLPVPVAIVMHM